MRDIRNEILKRGIHERYQKIFLDEKENIPKLVDAAKAVLTRKFITLNSYIRK